MQLTPKSLHRQAGASLIIGLVLLMVLSVLAVSTMGGASLQLAMSGNTQYSQNAFQMAETGIDRSFAIANTFIPNGPPVTVPLTAVADPGTGANLGSYQATSTYMQETLPPEGGYSIGSGISTFRACHFQTQAIGRSTRNSADLHTQELYRLCFGSGT
jgi:type IV pilus assembly protein PilX